MAGCAPSAHGVERMLLTLTDHTTLVVVPNISKDRLGILNRLANWAKTNKADFDRVTMLHM